MASQLTRNEVAHVARLAHLELAPAELDTLTRQLTDILAYAAIVQTAADTEAPAGAPERPSRETSEPLRPAPMRPDSPIPSLRRDEVLAEAPDAARESGLFRVPKVR